MGCSPKPPRRPHHGVENLAKLKTTHLHNIAFWAGSTLILAGRINHVLAGDRSRNKRSSDSDPNSHFGHNGYARNKRTTIFLEAVDKITMINHSDYFRSYDIQYINDLTEEIRQSARVTIIRVNKLITALQQNEIALQINPRYDSVVNSGWRPPAINAAIPTAALASKHMLGQACDLHDPGGDIDEWCMTH